MRHEVRFSGFGGQGIALAGYILGKAACIHAGYHAVMTQNYGPESRGGASSADLIVNDSEIAYPKVNRPTHLVLMSQEAYNKYRGDVESASTVLTDADLVELEAKNEGKAIQVPFTRIADTLGRKIFANMVMLGAMTEVTGIVPKEAMLEAIRTTVPPKTVGKNLQAFEMGVQAVKERSQGVQG